MVYSAYETPTLHIRWIQLEWRYACGHTARVQAPSASACMLRAAAWLKAGCPRHQDEAETIVRMESSVAYVDGSLSTERWERHQHLDVRDERSETC